MMKVFESFNEQKSGTKLNKCPSDQRSAQTCCRVSWIRTFHIGSDFALTQTFTVDYIMITVGEC